MALPLLGSKFPESILGASWQRREASSGDSVLFPFISFPWNSILKDYSSLENMTPDMWKIMIHLIGPPVLPCILYSQLIPSRKVGFKNKRNRLSEDVFTSSDWSICSFTALLTKLPLRCVCVRCACTIKGHSPQHWGYRYLSGRWISTLDLSFYISHSFLYNTHILLTPWG